MSRLAPDQLAALLLPTPAGWPPPASAGQYRAGDEVYSSLGGMWPGDCWPNQLFVNESELENAWGKIRLRAHETNRFGLGARIRVEALDSEGRAIVRSYQMDNKTGFGSGPYLGHVGLLDAVEIRRLEAYWPVSRCRHDYTAELRSIHVLDEALCEASNEKEMKR